MIKIKQDYLDIALLCFFFFALSCFVVSIYTKNQSYDFLDRANSKLLLMEARRRASIDKSLTGISDAAQILQTAMNKVGLKTHNIKQEDDVIIAITDKNDAACKKLKNTINCETIDKNFAGKKMIEIRWIYKEGNIEYEKQKFEKTNDYILNGICFFDNGWQVWINGKYFDENNKTISKGVVIQNVKEDCVTINANGKIIELKSNF